MKGDFHVRFCGNAGVKLPCVTRLGQNINYMKTNFIFIFLFLVLLTSCHKNNPNEESRHFIDSRLTGQKFKPGSYWIYFNDSTQKTDCTYVFKVESGYFERSDDPFNSKMSLNEYYDIFYHDKDSVKLNDF